MYVLDENKIKLLHKLMKEKGVHKVDTTMFLDEQRKKIYESYGDQFFMYNGIWFMANYVTSYALAKNLEKVNKKLQQELEYALKQYDYDYALLCAKLMNNEEMMEFLKQYSKSNKYDKIFLELNNFILEAKK